MPGEITRVGPKFQVTIPKQVREVLGLRVGDFVQASVGRGRTIVIRRKRLVDFDAALEEDLAAAEADYRAGRLLGPFDTAEETMAALRQGSGSPSASTARDARKKAGRRIKSASRPRHRVKPAVHARAAHP